MKIVCISDTHSQQGELFTTGCRLKLPEGDLLIHAGDLTSQGRPAECAAALSWLGTLAQRFTHGAVVIAGNHDFLAERDPEAFAALVPRNVTYLNDSGTEIGGLRFWGSPITPWFHDWAFNRRPGRDLAAHWAKIPASVDVLVTHGPVQGIHDRVPASRFGPAAHVGCPQLREVVERVRPRLFVCGHIHEGYGTDALSLPGTTFVNASILDGQYRPANQPVSVTLS
ncbi:metallophosphoesterase [Deinococcus sp. 23YEL01]|uniref:metallophosphoesterase family protein n=1 Tax=Deinococcus sp. 23YEL01 TaxID=2745871 RepID=UPI001E3A8EE7|nr:metallophosphatase domain-containing protein [Deinococcus sp. 23YEL01]MCD0168153.1 metallophosphatase domain-containing protein [Deinococcus sp. 23YEL01]